MNVSVRIPDEAYPKLKTHRLKLRLHLLPAFLKGPNGVCFLGQYRLAVATIGFSGKANIRGDVR